MSTHDLVIRGATLVDGSGNAACIADVAVDRGTITAENIVEDGKIKGARFTVRLPAA